MQFNIKGTAVKISFSFFSVLLFSLVSDTHEICFYSFIVSLIHELIHILFLIIFRAKFTEISLTLFGGRIQREPSVKLTDVREAIISLSAPAFNIVTGVIFICFFGTDCIFGIVNLFIGLFNILPFYSFDGGRGLYYLLILKFSEKTVDLILTLTSVLITISFSFFSVFIFLNHRHDYILLLLSVYMIFSLLFKRSR